MTAPFRQTMDYSGHNMPSRIATIKIAIPLRSEAHDNLAAAEALAGRVHA